jgi:hypothetical protein
MPVIEAAAEEMGMAKPSMRWTADERPPEIRVFLGERLTASFHKLICQDFKTLF